MNSQLEFIKQPDLSVITGSRLYGTERYDANGLCISDIDIRGFVLPPVECLIGIQGFDEGSLEGDHKIWSLKNFCQMLLKGNAQCLECLFVPLPQILKLSNLGCQLLGNKEMFLGKHYYKSISGFAYSEWRKVRGVKLVVPDRQKTEDDVVQAYLNVFNHHPKDLKDQIIEMMFSLHEKKEVASKSDVGEKRRKEYDLYGYCASGASHAIRLLFQCEELLKDHRLTFPRPEAKLLSQIKRGDLPFEQVEKLYNDLSARVEDEYKNSSLPDRADAKAIWKWYETVVREYILKSLLKESQNTIHVSDNLYYAPHLVPAM